MSKIDREHYENIGTRIKVILKEKGIKHYALARILEWSDGKTYKMLAGKIEINSHELTIICDTLEISADYVLETKFGIAASQTDPKSPVRTLVHNLGHMSEKDTRRLAIISTALVDEFAYIHGG